MGLETIIISKNLDDFNQSIKDDIVRKGINDTGSAANSLKVVVKGEKVASVGNDYIEVLDKGRSPGKFAPVDNIRDWVATKLGITSNPELNQVAYLVNRKIAREGTAIFKDNTKGLEISKKIETLSNNLKKDLQVFAKANVIEQLNKFQKQRQQL